jgi:hypothetical protein
MVVAHLLLVRGPCQVTRITRKQVSTRCPQRPAAAAADLPYMQVWYVLALTQPAYDTYVRDRRLVVGCGHPSAAEAGVRRCANGS